MQRVFTLSIEKWKAGDYTVENSRSSPALPTEGDGLWGWTDL